jgi:predicted TIM-barrel fold metal-dependent hydrolase
LLGKYFASPRFRLLKEPVPSAAETARLLAMARELGRGHLLTDAHAHPFEVMAGGFPPPAADAGYRPPVPGPLPQGGDERDPSRRALLLGARLAFRHTGEKAFRDHTALCGVERTLLLPVPRSAEEADAVLGAARMRFPDARDFPLAAGLPPGIPPGDILPHLREMASRHRVAALKLHPPLTGIDPGTREGKRYIEEALVAAAALSLPVVVHGGRSPGVAGEGSSFATLRVLQEIDWGLARGPVVIAHGGLYMVPPEEHTDVVGILHRLLDSHPHLLVDTSGLDQEALTRLLRAVSPARVLFGSDALYFPPWRAVALLLNTLLHLSREWEKEFLLIASDNPERILFSRTFPLRHAQGARP